MTPNELYEATRGGLDIAGYPEWPNPDHPATGVERLTFLQEGKLEDMDEWVVASFHDEGYLAIDLWVAEALIRSRLQQWLLDRGWQVQATTTRTGRMWRLVDCLTFADGGGDRLDGEYPVGTDELRVLSHSVATVASNARSRRPLGP